MIRHTSRPKKTVDDYMSLPDDVRVELIEGEFFMSPSPTLRHQQVVCNLLVALRGRLQARKLGSVFVAPLDVHLPSGDIVQPDVLYIAEGNEGIKQDWIRGVPDLAIEVVSPDAPERDRIVKRDLYARNGIREYWIVDDAAGSVEVLKLAGDTYEAHGYFELQDTVESSLLADVQLPAREIFA